MGAVGQKGQELRADGAAPDAVTVAQLLADIGASCICCCIKRSWNRAPRGGAAGARISGIASARGAGRDRDHSPLPRITLPQRGTLLIGADGDPTLPSRAQMIRTSRRSLGAAR